MIYIIKQSPSGLSITSCKHTRKHLEDKKTILIRLAQSIYAYLAWMSSCKLLENLNSVHPHFTPILICINNPIQRSCFKIISI